jgi:hypothetical protein
MSVTGSNNEDEVDELSKRQHARDAREIAKESIVIYKVPRMSMFAAMQRNENIKINSIKPLSRS